jgi:F-type H+-transporting ATPase subunit epsilon
MNKFMLNITASSGEFYQGDCEDLVLPTGDGVYGVQAGHNPVLVAIHMGILHFEVNGEARDILVGDGIAEVTPAYVMVLVDSAERPEDIDKNRAEAARIRAPAAPEEHA